VIGNRLCFLRRDKHNWMAFERGKQIIEKDVIDLFTVMESLSLYLLADVPLVLSLIAVS
jgi:hypothetical protein